MDSSYLASELTPLGLMRLDTRPGVMYHGMPAYYNLHPNPPWLWCENWSYEVSPTSTTQSFDLGVTPPFSPNYQPIQFNSIPPIQNYSSTSHVMNRPQFESYLNDTEFTIIPIPKRSRTSKTKSSPLPITKPTQETLLHVCPIPSCQRAFKRPEHLKRHTHSLHEKARPYTCPTCQRTFSRSDNLHQHQKIHTR